VKSIHPPAVKEAKKRALRYVKDIMLVDTGAGTGSHISMAIKDSKLLVAVTEPNPSWTSRSGANSRSREGAKNTHLGSY